MTNKEVFEYISTTDDKSGILKKECGFRIRYPELYQEYLNTEFPDNLKDLPFKQKLWHFLNDTYEVPRCKNCGQPVGFSTNRKLWGYRTYCTGACSMHDPEVQSKLDNTKLERYGDKNYNNSKKQQETVKTMYGEDWWVKQHNKSAKTRREKNNGQYFSTETLQKIADTNFERYGVPQYAKTKAFSKLMNDNYDSIRDKSNKTKLQNNSFNTSKIEEQFTKWLTDNNINFIRQYRSEQYQFACDFYFPDKDLYFEINASWTHGGHLFNSENTADQETLAGWKSKKSKYYDNAIETWTARDPKKYKTAQEHHLNWIAVYSNNLDDIIKEYDRR